MKRLAALLAVLAVASPAAGGAPHVRKQQALFVFGRSGGSIRPFRASIAADGVVSVSGGVRRLGSVTLPRPALGGLQKLAQAVGFYSLPANINCPGPGGFANEYIHVHTATRDKRVQEYGGCRPGFDQLFEVLKAVSALRD